MKLRYYQEDCIKSLYDWLHTEAKEPLCVLPTGTGKSIVIAQFIKTFLQQFPNTRIICCIDTKELVEQNYLALKGIWQNAPAGVYSAGLKRKQSGRQVLFGGIQSMYNKSHVIGRADILIVDEAHMANCNPGSMWNTFIKELQPQRIIGFTATPYRNDCGVIYSGKGTVFDGICYEYSVKQAMKDKYLSDIIPKTMTTHFDTSGIKMQNGDFSESELQDVVNTDEKNEAVIEEIIKYGKDRKGWLIFSAGCEHARQLDAILASKGYEGGVVLGDTPDTTRDKLIRDFKDRKLQYLINNAVLTKGFDAPHIDLLAAVRPTMSPVLWAQMVGRAFRICDDKENALLLDFAENIQRFGFIDEIEYRKRKKNDVEGVPPTKTCPDCDSILHAALRECPYCGFEFPKPEPEFNKKAYGGAVLSTQVVPEWKEVEAMYVSKHKTQKPTPTLRIEYVCTNLERYFEYICLEHEAGSFPRNKAIGWWLENTDKHLIKDIDITNWLVREHGVDTIPKTIDDAVKMQEAIIKPSRIKVIQDGKWWRVTHRDNRAPVSTKEGPRQDCQLAQEDIDALSEEVFL